MNMKFYSKISSMLVAAAFLSILPVEAQTFRQTKQGITGTTQGMDIEIQFISPEIVRVVKAPEGRSFTKKSLSVVKSPESMSVTAEKKGETVSLKSNAVRVDFSMSRATAAVSLDFCMSARNLRYARSAQMVPTVPSKMPPTNNETGPAI